MQAEKAIEQEKPDVYEILKTVVIKMKPKNRFCCLIFNEYSVNTSKLSKIDKNREPPKYILIFMLRGLSQPWKQPICCVFWNRQSEQHLARTIQTIIRQVHSSGLTIVSTVSDHSKMNIGAIKFLMTESKTTDYSYIVDYSVIYHIFDPLRLFKSLRNSLVEHDLIYELQGKQKTASWNFIEAMYQLDQSRGKFKTLPKLSVFHINRTLLDRRNTMRIAQVFSESVGMEITHSVKSRELEKPALETSELILFLDKLFDSCNGEATEPQYPKVLKVAITCGSYHFNFWHESIKVLDSMRFVLESNKVYRADFLDMFPVSLQNMQNVFKALKKVKIKQFSTRRMNLDCLTNLVQIIRVVNHSHCEVVCEETEGKILSQQILRMVLLDEYGSFEIE